MKDPGPSWAVRGLLVAAALALALVFQAGLLFGGSLHHFDWAIHWHYYDWIRIGLAEHGQLPRFMIDAWHTPNFVANAQAPVLGPLVWLLAFLPTEPYVKLLLVLYTAFGALGGFALARALGARPALAACAAVLWTCGGWFAAHVAVGHHWSLGAYGLPWLLLAVMRAAEGSRPALLAAVLLEALPLLEGQHHPFLWQNGLLGLWAVFESGRARSPAPLAALATALLFGVALAGVRVVPVLLEFADYAPEARIGGLPPGALPFALASRGQGPGLAGEPLGVVYAHGSGWWEYAFYLGLPGLAFVAIGIVLSGWRHVPLLLAGLVAGLLCLDTTALGFDVWSFLQHVPVATSQRSPSRLLLLSIFAGVFAATAGWERWLAGRRLAPRAVSVAFGLWALLMAADLVGAARPWQAAALGPPQVERPHRMATPRLAPPAIGRVEVIERTPNRLRFRVESDRDAFLVFGLRYGVQRDAWRADDLPMVGTPDGALAVRVPAGKRELTMRYRTPGLVAGIALSLCCALLLGVLGRHGGALPWQRLAHPPGAATPPRG